jgi:dynein heavy chain
MEAQAELELARPALEAAKAAIDCLDKASLTELKALQKPPPGVDVVLKVVLVMLLNEKKNLSWEAGKKLMANVSTFKARLEAYRCGIATRACGMPCLFGFTARITPAASGCCCSCRADQMPEEVMSRMNLFVSDPSFRPDTMMQKSVAAANICTWAINMLAYARVYRKVRAARNQTRVRLPLHVSRVSFVLCAVQ